MTESKPKRQLPKGRIITFYSYKGGTGRSMALANIAWMLALCGQRVLVVDWDLEAPGIHRYFHPLLEDKELTATEGLLDFVEKLETRAAMAKGPLGEEDVDVIEYVTMLKWPAASNLSWKDFGANAGLDLLGAGQQGPGYSAKLNAFNWIEFYEKLGGRRLLEIAGRQLKDVYDYVLIDSRTGVSDTSGICTVEMPDTLVVCFTLNEQSIIGASGIAHSVRTQRNSRVPEDSATGLSRPFRILPVPTRVEIGSERLKREVALTAAKRQFSSFVEGMSGRYWGSVQLPYFAFYAFEEIPAVFGDLPNDKLSLLTPIREIAREITGDPTLDLPPLHKDEMEAERLRKEVLSWYLRKAESKEQNVVALAQKTWLDFDPASQDLMKRVTLRLVQVSAASPPSPLTSTLEDIEKPLHDMAARLTTAGILQTSGSNIYIADRKVVENWELLRQWIRDDEAFLIWRQDLAAAAQRWRASERDGSGLLRGKLLDVAREWLARRPADLTANERDFIATSYKSKPLDLLGFKVSVPGTSLKIGFPVLALAALLGILALVGVTGSYVANGTLKAEIEENQRAVAALNAATLPASLPDDLLTLERLKETVEKLNVYRRDGVPLRLRWGLYAGDRLEPEARKVYFGAFQRLLLEPTQTALLAYLSSLPARPLDSSDYSVAYDALKAYLIMTSERSMSTPMFLSPVLMRYWSPAPTAVTVSALMAQRQFDFYSQELQSENPFPTEGNAVVIERTRTYLSQFGGVERLYQLIVTEASRKSTAIAFNRLYPGSTPVIVAASEVSGAFTKAGWPIMQDEIKNSGSYTFSGEPWVLGRQQPPDFDRANLDQRLANRYVEEFIDRWQQFLGSASIKPYSSIDDAAAKLRTLAGLQSPLLALFCLVSQNTRVGDPQIQKAFQTVQQIAPPTCMDKYNNEMTSTYAKALAALADSIDEFARSRGSSALLREEIRKRAVQAQYVARSIARSFPADADNRLGDVVLKLMESPIAAAESVLRTAGMSEAKAKSRL